MTMISGLKNKVVWRCVLVAVWLCLGMDTRADDITSTLAKELSRQGDHRGAALEFRRLALAEEDTASQSGYFWAAGHEYWRAGMYDIAGGMLDQAGDSHPLPPEADLVRSENAAASRNVEEAIFYLEGVLQRGETAEQKNYAARRLAELQLRQRNPALARETLLMAPDIHMEGVEAIDRFKAGRDKTPWIGGLLGVIPGLGYFYAGEYANGFRSLILNAIFIYGMVDTANDDNWGAFTVITFFQFTWYSGSIYGGIDASHRYNQHRMDSTAEIIRGEASFAPEYQQLPLISLRFSF